MITKMSPEYSESVKKIKQSINIHFMMAVMCYPSSQDNYQLWLIYISANQRTSSRKLHTAEIYRTFEPN